MMVWVELSSGGDPDWTQFFTPERKSLKRSEVSVLQQERADKVCMTFEETVCEADDCVRIEPAPLGYWLDVVDDYDVAVNTSFYVSSDGKALCEECGEEAYELELSA